MSTTVELAKAGLDALAGKDRKSWLTLWENDAVLDDPVGTEGFARAGSRFVGVEAIAGFWDNVIAKTGRLRYEIERSYPGGDVLALAIHFQTTRGEQVSHLHALNVYTRSKNGKLASMQSFWDETFRMP